jgi:hypothetical protein
VKHKSGGIRLRVAGHLGVAGGLDRTGQRCPLSRPAASPRQPSDHMPLAKLLRNFISFYHQAYRTAVWRSRHDRLC